MKYALVDHNSFPIVKADFQMIDPTVELVDILFDELEQICYAHEGKFLLYFSNKVGGNWVNQKARKQIAIRMLKFSEDFSERFTTLILVFPFAISRLAIKGVNHLLSEKISQHLFSSDEEANLIISNFLEENKNDKS